MDWQALIDSQSAFALIPPQLRSLAERFELEAGDTLFRIDERIRRVFSVVSGEVRLVRRGRNGREIVLQRARGGFFAEASLFNKVYHCDAVVAEAGEALRFPLQAFRTALDEDRDFRNAWMTHLAGEVRNLRSRCERLSLHSAEERIVHCIEAAGGAGAITLNQSRKAWAAELGLTHEALYRALRRLQVNGTLQVHGRHIALV